MRLWLDDVRPAPEGWTLATSAERAIELLAAGGATHVSLDHDLGCGKAFETTSGVWVVASAENEGEAGTGYDVACWIEREAFAGRLGRLVWTIHSQNPAGAARIRAAMQGAERAWVQREGKGGQVLRAVVTATAALLLALASPLAAQEAEPPADAKQPVSTATILVDKSEPPVEPGLYAAAFCTQRKGENDPSARCDLGVAVPLYHRVSPETRRGWAVVGFLGGGGAGEGEDLGIAGVGSSWLFPVGERQGGLGLGWSVLWGGEGIDVADGRLTVGFTIGGRR